MSRRLNISLPHVQGIFAMHTMYQPDPISEDVLLALMPVPGVDPTLIDDLVKAGYTVVVADGFPMTVLVTQGRTMLYKPGPPEPTAPEKIEPTGIVAYGNCELVYDGQCAANPRGPGTYVWRSPRVQAFVCGHCLDAMFKAGLWRR